MYNDDELIKHINSIKFPIKELSSEAKGFFQANFSKGGTEISKWEKKGDGSESHLKDKSDSIKKEIKNNNISETEFKIISDLNYSKINNDGGEIKVTEKQLNFFKSKMAENKSNKKEFEKWQKIYYSAKNKGTISIPKRNFIYDSKLLVENLIKIINKKIFNI